MADAPETQNGGTCPTCGSPVESGQLVCLTCGARVGLQYNKPPPWQIPVILATLVVAVAVVGAFFALKAATGEGENEVATKAQTSPEIAPPELDPGRNAPSEEAPREEPPREEPPREEPPREDTAREDAPPEEPPSQDAGLRGAKRGPTAVLSGVPEPGAAAKFAKRLKRRGFRIGAVANAPGPSARSIVRYARGGKAAAGALAKAAGIKTVKALDEATAAPAAGAKLVVVVGASP